MASPHAESFYCLLDSEFSNRQLDIYNAICVVSSLFGLSGAAHQIRTLRDRIKEMQMNGRGDPAAHRRRQSHAGFGANGQDGFVNPHVVLGLAKADFAACLVLIVRSFMSFATKRPVPIGDKNSTESTDTRYDPYHWWYTVIGSPIELLLLYSFVATYFWTFTYALTVNLKLHNRQVSNNVLSYFCWLAPLLPTAVNGFVKFYPFGVVCADSHANLYTAYMCLYAPLILVMILNPLIYINSYKTVEQLMQRRGRLTNNERQVLLAIKYKFFLIMLFFYICWMLNVVDGIIEISVNRDAPFGILVAEAVLNPLQGLFNVLVYGRHNFLKYFLLRLTHRRLSQAVNIDNDFGKETDRLVETSTH